MDELFRMSVARPAERTKAPTLAVDQDSNLLNELRDAETWEARHGIALAYLNGTEALLRLDDLVLYAELAQFLAALKAVPPPFGVDALTRLAGGLLTDTKPAALEAMRRRLIDNFVALYIAPRRDRPSLVEIAELLRALALLERIRAKDKALEARDAVPKALALTLALPAFFTVPEGRVRPVGIADLLVVKQHIKGYEPGEIARIENVLKGETRKHTQRHTLVNETSTTFESETTTERTEELTTTDKVDIKTEVDQTLKEDFNLKAGVSLGLSGSGYEFKSNFDTAYDRSSSESAKFASEVAKDVTRRAASKVTQRIKLTQTTKTTETFDELEDQGFENKTGDNTSGIYQWVEKVYEAQVFNYDKHLLFDLLVPEPAAFVLAAAGQPKKNPPPRTPPPALTVGPLDISHNDPTSPAYYPKLVQTYQVIGVEPPPPEKIVIAKAFATAEAGDGGDVNLRDELEIQSGYQANAYDVVVSFYHRGGVGSKDPQFQLSVGNDPQHFDKDNSQKWGDDEYQATVKGHSLGGVAGRLGVAIQTAFISRISANLEVYCSRTTDRLNQWKLETYEKIVARYVKLKADFDEQQAAEEFEETAPALLGRDPDTNRQIERNEIKKSCISILTGQALAGTDDVTRTTTPPNPAIKVPESLRDGPRVRFFEQAFEWDKIGYVFYPYYWSHTSTWFDRLNLSHGDPLFESFLKAGYARVVVPVRKGFEEAILYFLITDQIWMGGALPNVTDPTYLPITEEIKEQTGAPDGGVPVGDPWRYRLPTQLIKLAKDDKLPTWTRPGPHPEPPPDPWTWVPG